MSHFGKYLDDDAADQHEIETVDNYKSEESSGVKKSADFQK